jgi:hypothetical protein
MHKPPRRQLKDIHQTLPNRHTLNTEARFSRSSATSAESYRVPALAFSAGGLCGAKIVNTVAELAFAGRSDGSAVLADQPGDGPSTMDPGGHVDHLARVVQQWSEGTCGARK